MAFIDWENYLPDEDDRKKLTDIFLPRRVTPPRVVHLDGLENLPCAHHLRAAKLDHLITSAEFTYPGMVKYFYSQIRPKQHCHPQFTTTIFGQDISITPSIINTIIKTPKTGFQVSSHEHFPGSTGLTEPLAMRTILTGSPNPTNASTVHSLYTNSLGPNFVVLEEIIQNIIFPRKGHSNEVSRLDIWLMASITLGRKINWGHFICAQILRAFTHSIQALPYGVLITLILQHFNIAIPDEFEYLGITEIDYIDKASLKRKGWTQADDGTWMPKAKKAKRTDGASTSSAPPPPPPPPPASTISSDQFDQIMTALATLSTSVSQRFDAIDQRFDSLSQHVDQRMTTFSQRFDSMDQRVDSFGSAMIDVQKKTTSISYSLEDLTETVQLIQQQSQPRDDDDDDAGDDAPGPDLGGTTQDPGLTTDDFDID